MLIDLKKTKYYFLTTGKDDERKNHMVDIFKDYDITEVIPILDIPRLQSGSIGMGRMIDLGLRNQDRTKPFQPFVILEDDVSFYRDFPENLEIPDDSDIFYIGISKCGSFGNRDKKLIIADDVNNDVVKLYNMLSAHGIIICSALGATVYQRCMMEGFIKNTYWDLPLSNIHPYYNVYALKQPLVYQDYKYRGCEEPTKFELQDYISSKNKEFYKNDLLYGMCYMK